MRIDGGIDRGRGIDEGIDRGMGIDGGIDLEGLLQMEE